MGWFKRVICIMYFGRLALSLVQLVGSVWVHEAMSSCGTNAALNGPFLGEVVL